MKYPLKKSAAPRTLETCLGVCILLIIALWPIDLADPIIYNKHHEQQYWG